MDDQLVWRFVMKRFLYVVYLLGLLYIRVAIGEERAYQIDMDSDKSVTTSYQDAHDRLVKQTQEEIEANNKQRDIKKRNLMGRARLRRARSSVGNIEIQVPLDDRFHATHPKQIDTYYNRKNNELVENFKSQKQSLEEQHASEQDRSRTLTDQIANNFTQQQKDTTSFTVKSSDSDMFVLSNNVKLDTIINQITDYVTKLVDQSTVSILQDSPDNQRVIARGLSEFMNQLDRQGLLSDFEKDGLQNNEQVQKVFVDVRKNNPEFDILMHHGDIDRFVNERMLESLPSRKGLQEIVQTARIQAIRSDLQKYALQVDPVVEQRDIAILSRNINEVVRGFDIDALRQATDTDFKSAVRQLLTKIDGQLRDSNFADVCKKDNVKDLLTKYAQTLPQDKVAIIRAEYRKEALLRSIVKIAPVALLIAVVAIIVGKVTD